jgi:hypothetical protein
MSQNVIGGLVRTLANLGESFRAAAAPLVPAFGTLAAIMAPVALWAAGYQAGRQYLPRDWDMPDHWHRGYLRGLLARMKANRRTAEP